MYRCTKCKYVFETPYIYSEFIGQDDQCGVVSYSECPNCHSGSIESLCCDNCGREVEDMFNCDNGHYYCSEECQERGEGDE